MNLLLEPEIYHDEGGGDRNLEALLARQDVQAVIIALPIMVQPEVIRICLVHGKHVLSEKPIAPSVQVGLELVNEYENNYKGKVIWRVAESEEAEPVYRKVKDLIMDGRIGKVAWWTLSSVWERQRITSFIRHPGGQHLRYAIILVRVTI